MRRWTAAHPVAVCSFFIIVAVGAACSFNTAASPTTSGARALKDGETFGKIERLPGGTAVASSVITLLAMSCTNGQLLARTNLQTITGKMDCAQEVPQPTLERFYGQVVSISYSAGRLHVESVSAGTLDLPVQEAMTRDVNATP